MSSAKGVGGWKMLTFADKGGGEVRQTPTLADKGGRGGLVYADNTDKMPKKGQR